MILMYICCVMKICIFLNRNDVWCIDLILYWVNCFLFLIILIFMVVFKGWKKSGSIFIGRLKIGKFI